MTTPTHLAQAARIVIEDQRRSYGPDQMTDAQCLVHVWETVDDEQLNGEDETASAYAAIIDHLDYQQPAVELAAEALAKQASEARP